MNKEISTIAEFCLTGGQIDRRQIDTLLQQGEDNFFDLLYWANRIREKFFGNKIRICSIVPGRLGGCDQDCKFCAQSGKHNTDVSVYPLKKEEEIVQAAKDAKAIGAKNGLEPDNFFHQATEIIYACGYVTGNGSEKEYWDLVRRECGISGNDAELTGEIHSRFILRPGMIDKVKAIKQHGLRAAILSDQTDWLEQLDQRDHFLQEFDPVLNSFYLGKTKRDPETFREALQILGLDADQVMFIDDNSGHIERAAKLGLQTHLFTGEAGFNIILTNLGIIE